MSRLLLRQRLPNGAETVSLLCEFGGDLFTLIPNVTNSSLQLINCYERITIATIVYFLLKVVPKVIIYDDDKPNGGRGCVQILQRNIAQYC